MEPNGPERACKKMFFYIRVDVPYLHTFPLTVLFVMLSLYCHGNSLYCPDAWVNALPWWPVTCLSESAENALTKMMMSHIQSFTVLWQSFTGPCAMFCPGRFTLSCVFCRTVWPVFQKPKVEVSALRVLWLTDASCLFQFLVHAKQHSTWAQDTCHDNVNSLDRDDLPG